MAECMVRNEIERIERESRWALRKSLHGGDDISLLNAQIALDAQRVLCNHLEHCSICSTQAAEPLFFEHDGHKRVLGNLSVLNAVPKGI